MDSELLALSEFDTTPALRYRAVLSVLRDLVRQGWQLEWFADCPTLVPQGQVRDISEMKSRVRRGLEIARQEQITQPATQRFLTGLQADPRFDGLVANGENLVDRLLNLGPSAVQPYLQLVEADVKDTVTGLKLMDIWRYFRHTWSTPYRSTPGRNLFYLVRDSGDPRHPVMGIAALGNSVIQLSARDDDIGWSTSSLVTRLTNLPESDAQIIIGNLRSSISDAVNAVSLKSLGISKRLLNENPTQAIRLAEEVAFAAEGRRRDFLTSQFLSDEESLAGDDHDTANVELFRAKRAAELAALLRAEFTLAQVDWSARALRDLLQVDEVVTALSVGLRVNKKRHIGSSLMEIIVCGGVPPYSDLLAGKLTGLLMASPQVRHDYVARYAGRASEIASRMSGRGVARSADLVYLGTTSLYGSGSSQYNRLRMPASAAGGRTGQQIAFELLGKTVGFGSVHFSSATRDLVEAVLQRQDSRREIRNRFGEGVSPGLRRLRSGLDALSLDSDRFLRHEQSRLVYGVRLASNAYEYLRGEAAVPDFIIPMTDADGRGGSLLISEYWKERWLTPRLAYTPALDRARLTARHLHQLST